MATATTQNSQLRNIQVYILAAPEDQPVCDDITKHLKPIMRSCSIPIEVKSDFDIPAGMEKEKHQRWLFESDIVLALISVDFIDNDEVYNRNQKVIERYNNHQTVMIPVLVRNFMWKATPFYTMPVVLPKNLQPLNNKQFWNSPDDAVTAVVKEIYDSINKLAQRQRAVLEPYATETAVRTPDVQEPSEPAIRQPASASPVAAEPPEQITDVQPSSATDMESAPKREAANAATVDPTGQVSAMSTVAADWRKKYYRTVAIKRAGAILLDHIIILGTIFIFSWTLWFVLPYDSDIWFSLILYFVIMPIMESSKWQGTIGKRILKLQITDRNGERITFLRAFWRNIMRTVMLYLYIVTFGILLIIQYFRFNKTKKLFHDELSGTVIGEKLASSSEAQVVAKAA